MPSGSYRPIRLFGWFPLLCWLLIQAQPCPGEKILALCSIQPVADWITQVGGDRVEVVSLVPAGQSPHTYAPSLKETGRFAGAQIAFEIGRGLDEWIFKKVYKTLDTPPKRVTLSEGLPALTLSGNPIDVEPKSVSDQSGWEMAEPEEDHSHSHSHEAGHGHSHDPEGPDPHVWLDPDLARIMIEKISRELGELDPDSKGYFEDRAKRYTEELEALDRELLSKAEGIRGRRFVAVHSAFVYFAEHFGLAQAALLEVVPGVSASLKDIRRVGEIYAENPQLEIWIEPQLSDREARILASELGGLPLRTVDPLGRPGENYAELLERNIETLLAPAKAAPQASDTLSSRLLGQKLGGSLLWRALLAAVMLGSACSLLSVIVVLRKMAFVGQGLSHAALGGVGIGLLIFPAAPSGDIRITLTTAVAVLLTAFAVGLASRRKEVSEDTAIGVFFVGAMALGIVAVRLSAGRPGGPVDPYSYLFGSAALIGKSDLLLIAAVTLVVASFIFIRYHEIHFFLYDERMARLSGVATTKLHYLLVVLLAVTIVCALNLIGIVLMSAYLVIPGATARLLTKRYHLLFILALLVGIATSTGGLLLSYWVELPQGATLPAGATVVLLQFATFLLTFGLSRWR
jgi:zinc transport system permease protein